MQIEKLKTPGSCRCSRDWARPGTSALPVICRICAGLMAVLVAGCGATRPAPVADRLPQETRAASPTRPLPKVRGVTAEQPRPAFYTVRTGDTLYSIALEFGLDYRELANWNGIDPARLRVGQQLRLTPPSGVVASPLRGPAGTVDAQPLDGSSGRAVAGGIKTEPRAARVPYSDQAYAQMANTKTETMSTAKPEASTDAGSSRPRDPDDIDWIWPVTGKIIAPFKDASSKGIAIAGKMGQPVVAAAPGRVIFSGTGIRGLGKLIVIKHNEKFLSVYAHNRELLVKEGQTVTRGQKIAEMGNTDSDQVKLHFEIRRLGKPVDPAGLLPPT